MDSIADRFSRLSVLRPRGDTKDQRINDGLPAGSGELLRLLAGECRSNRMGNHVVVRSVFSQPVAGALDFTALRLIHPGSMEILSNPRQWLFLDTETTGLAGGTGTYAFLVGLAWWEEEKFVVEQYFMRDHREEPSMLLGLLECFSRRPVLVSFNGKRFDWPLLQTRFQIRRLKTFAEPCVHLDLLHPARRLWRLCCSSVALVRLERQILGIDRGPDIPSETIPQRYFDFLRGGSPQEMVEVFHHNRMDLCGLGHLLLHITKIVSDPGNCTCRPEELYGVSQLLCRQGETQLAGKIYQRALDAGLPREVEPIACRELAVLAKRERNFELSNALWEKLLGDSTEWPRAYEQLAIYYEHYGRLPWKAAMLSREALGKLQEAFHSGQISSSKYLHWHRNFRHRLSRLMTKLAEKH